MHIQNITMEDITLISVILANIFCAITMIVSVLAHKKIAAKLTDSDNKIEKEKQMFHFDLAVTFPAMVFTFITFAIMGDKYSIIISSFLMVGYLVFAAHAAIRKDFTSRKAAIAALELVSFVTVGASIILILGQLG